MRRHVSTFAVILVALTSLAQSKEDRQQSEIVDLGRAVRMADTVSVDRAIAQGQDLDTRLRFGATPLMWAADSQDLALVQKLLRAGADPNLVDDDGVSALMLACELGGKEVILELIGAGANVRDMRSDGVGPLAICAGHAPADTVEAILNQGAPPDPLDERGLTPLMWAAAGGHTESLRVLVEAGANVNALSETGFTPLFFAIKSQCKSALEALLSLGADPAHIGPKETSAAQLAVYQKNFEAVHVLMKHGADIHAYDRHGHTLLHAAAAGGEAHLVSELIQAGADPNELTRPSKIEYVTEANFGIPPPEIPPLSPLMLAAENGAVEVMEVLLAAHADPLFKDENARTLVHAATKGGSADALTLALSRAHGPNAVTRTGATPLHLILYYATWEGLPLKDAEDMMLVLKEAGASADIPNADGRTATMDAEEGLTILRSAFAHIFSPQDVIDGPSLAPSSVGN